MIYRIWIISIIIILLNITSISLGGESNNSSLYKIGTSFEKINKNDKIKLFRFIHSPKNDKRFTTKTINNTTIRKDSQGYTIEDLLIFDNDTLITVIEGNKGENGLIFRRCWNPEGSKLAYTKGDYSKGDRLIGHEIWIYDIEKRRSIPIVTGLNDKYLMEINWAEFDNNLYVWDYRKVYRVDFEKKELILTEYKGINFSPDGSFYYDSTGEGEEGRLYRRETNEVIWNSYPENSFLNQPMGWGKNKKGETLLYVVYGSYKAGIVNCETGELKVFENPKRGFMQPEFIGENVIWNEKELRKK
jgi:WD40 repeat protein